jgi:uncharacterized protein (DUF58 family)
VPANERKTGEGTERNTSGRAAVPVVTRASADTRSRTHTNARTNARTNGRTSTRTSARGATGLRDLTSTSLRADAADDAGLAANARLSVARTLRRARRALARAWSAVTAVVTPLGWAVAVLAIAGLAAGYALGWTEFVVIGWAAVIAAAVAALFLIGRIRHGVTLHLADDRVVVGATAVGQLTIGNPGLRLLPAITVDVPVGEAALDVPVPPLAPRQQIEELFRVPATRRGVFSVGPARATRRDPLGLVRREHAWTDASALYVHPLTVSVPSLSTGFVRDLEGSPTRDLTSDDVSFHALREYAPGDERRSIHWRSTAKTGRFMVRQYEETRRSHLMVALSARADEYASDEEFELAVSVAASLGVRAIRDTRTVSVVTGEVTPEFSRRTVRSVRAFASVTPTRLLDDLAAVELEDRALDLAATARAAADTIGGISLAFLVCGSATEPAAIREAARQLPLGVDVVAIVCESEGVPAQRVSAGLTVVTIGYLDDLRPALNRAVAL